MRVLIVDDHDFFRCSLRELLQNSSLTVEEASTGSEALERVRSTPYDAVVLDLSLPDRHGLEVLKEIKAEQQTLPVLIMSMYAEDRWAQVASASGASAYIVKDAASRLLEALDHVLKGGQFFNAATEAG